MLFLLKRKMFVFPLAIIELITHEWGWVKEVSVLLTRSKIIPVNSFILLFKKRWNFQNCTMSRERYKYQCEFVKLPLKLQQLNLFYKQLQNKSSQTTCATMSGCCWLHVNYISLIRGINWNKLVYTFRWGYYFWRHATRRSFCRVSVNVNFQCQRLILNTYF